MLLLDRAMILLEFILSLFINIPAREDRSIVGESPMEKGLSRSWRIIVAVILVGCVVAAMLKTFC